MSASERLKVRVLRRDLKKGNILDLELIAAEGIKLPSFTAGAHVDVHISDVITRPYSLCSDPGNPGSYRLGILKEADSRGGSRWMHDQFNDEAILTIGLPKNQFPLVENASHSMLIGGGIGITPLIAMAYALHATGESFSLHYCVRGEGADAYSEELLAMPFADRVRIHYDSSVPHPKLDPATDFPANTDGAHIYTCGPAGFMEWIFKSAAEQGFKAEQLHKEDFSADVDRSGTGFIVEAQASGVTLEVPEGKTIAECLRENGIEVEVSCEEGICGTCLTDVIEGEPDHRDQYLTDEEKEEGELILVCCSRAKSPKLVLDI